MKKALSEWFYHADSLTALGEDRPFGEKLEMLHDYLRQTLPWLDRVAVALYDPDTDWLKTYAHSSRGDNPLSLYEARLSTSRTLQEIVRLRQPRVVNDLDSLSTRRLHGERIRDQGYGSSYTLPIFRRNQLLGMLFFNSYQKHVLDEASLCHLDVVGHLVGYALMEQLSTTRTLVASIRSTASLAQQRDFETGSHLERMAHYARLIAKALAPRYGLDDAMVEHIFLFAPLHDIGKIGLPDHILLKPGKLTPEEQCTMRSHPERGAQIIDALLHHFCLTGVPHSALLRNIALSHHEAMNGQGYPHGLKGQDIPIEARIAAVADVFDALTSKRPYKEAWSNAEAFALLEELAGDVLDHDCVQALLLQTDAIVHIQERFRESISHVAPVFPTHQAA